MTNTNSTASDGTLRFPSLASLRAAHSDLLKRFRANGATPEIITEAEAFIRRGKATGAFIDHENERWSAQSELDYWSTQLYQPGLEPLDATLDEFDPQLAPELEDTLCPYVGLDAFHESNQPVFFGRQRLVTDLVDKLKTSRFLAVFGSSGSGKSSVVRAGLIPELKKGVLSGSSDWKYLAPMLPGSNPLLNLARLMTPLGEDTSRAIVDAKSYRENPAYLAKIVSERFNNNVVLVVDQFEEIFTLCTDDVNRNRFVDNLLSLCQIPNAEHRVIITMRSDFEMHISRLPELQKIIDRVIVHITPLTAGELREAIEAPAARVGLKFEEGVVNALMNDILGEPAALPLLQFTLLKLWEKRERNRVTWEAYKNLGGGRLALAQSADAFYNQLIPEEQLTMRRILLKMVRPGEGLEVTSNRVPISLLYHKAEAKDRIDRVLSRLIKARLVRRSEGDMAIDDQIEIAHEALVRNWPRLVEWLEEERIMLRQRQRLTTAAEEWQRLNGASAALWRRELLEEARRYDDLNDLERKFINASNARQARVQVAWISGTIAIITALATAAIIATQNAAEAKQQAKLALANGLASQAQLMIETRNSKQTAAVLLAVRSMQLSPSVQASQILQNTILASSIATVHHDDWVNEVAFSPDGKYVVSGSDDGTARVWEAATGEEIARMTHDNWVNSVAFSPDGKYVVSGGDDGTARVWEAATGNEIARMLHDSYVYSVAFSPDGKYVLSAGCDAVDNDYNCTKSTALVWEAVTGVGIARMSHEGDIYDLEFTLSSDVKNVLSAGCDVLDADGYCTQATAHVWETFTGKEIANMTHEGDIYSYVFSPDGNHVVSGSDDKTARVWETDTGNEVARMTHESYVNSVAFSPDGNYVVSGSGDGTARVWETDTGNEVARMTHEEWVDVVTFSPDGKHVLSAGCDRLDNDYNCTLQTARVWETATGSEIGRMTYGGDEVSLVAFSPDGRHVVSTGCELFENDGNCTQGTARIWETATRKESAHITHNGDISSIVFSPDGNYVVSGSDDGTARVWETVTRNEVARMTPESYVNSVAFSPDGQFIASGSGDGTVQVWDIFTGNEIARMIHPGWIDVVDFSPNARYVLSAGCDVLDADGYCTQATVHVWEATAGNEVARMTHESYVNSVAFSPDGNYVVSGSDDKTARVWETDTGNEVARMTHESYVNSVAFSSNGKYVVSAGCDELNSDGFCTTSTARVWETGTQKEIARMIHAGYVYSVAFSPDSQYVVSRGTNNFVLLWEATTGNEIARMIHEDFIYSVAFSSDGQYLVTGSDDNTVRVWEIPAGKEIARITHNDWVSSVAFSPDGQHVLSGSGDRTVQVWNWKPSDLIANACSRLTRNFTSGEWKQYMGDEPYQVICANLPIHPAVIADKILPILLDANKNDRVRIAIKLATDLLEQNAPNGNINELAIALVRDTIRNEISRVAWGFELDSGQIGPALILLDDAQLIGLEIDDADELNNVCWEGSIYGYAKDVLQYCEQAVALAPNEAYILDSRGLARALTGDYSGAIEDFQYFVEFYDDEELIQQRQRWIIDLQAGKNPFTPEELETLKEQ